MKGENNMAKALRVISDEEIKEFTKQGKGLSAAQCTYYWYLCFVGLPGNGPSDSGTCSWIMQQCGWGNSGGSGGRNNNCGTCTCH